MVTDYSRSVIVFMIKLLMLLRKKCMLKSYVNTYFENISSPLIADIDKCTKFDC